MTWKRQVGDRVALKFEPTAKGTIRERVIMWETECYNILGDDGASVTGILDDDLIDLDEPKQLEAKQRKRYDAQGCRTTNCCGVYSKFMDNGDGSEVLCCRMCKKEVSTGEGDGSETIYDR